MLDTEAIGLGDTLAIIAIVASLSVAWIGLASAHFTAALKDPKDLERIRQDYCQNGEVRDWNQFQESLHRLLAHIDRFYGFIDKSNNCSTFLKPYGRSVQLAFIYPIIILLLGYLATGTSSLVGEPILNNNTNTLHRVLFTFDVAASAYILFLVFSKDWPYTAAAWALKKIPAPENNRIYGVLELAFAVFFTAVAFLSVSLNVLTMISITNIDLQNSLTVSFVGSALLSGAAAGVISGFYLRRGVFFIILFCGLNVFSFEINSSASVTVAIILVLFPFANSIVDWASISITRRFMRKWICNHFSSWHKARAYIFWSLLDFAGAISCLLFLSILFSAGSIIENTQIVEPKMRIDWLMQMTAFRDDPFGEGFIITGMMFSTLLPTVFHLATGAAAITKMPHLGRSFVLNGIADGVPGPSQRVLLGLVMSIQFVVPVMFWGLIIITLLRFVLPIGDWAYGVAEFTWVTFSN